MVILDMRVRNITIKLFTVFLGTAALMSVIPASQAHADTNDVKDAIKHIVKASKHQIEKADKEQIEFTQAKKNKNQPTKIQEKLNLESNADEKKYQEYKARFTADENLKNKILKNIPFKEDAGYAWNVVNGDVDLYFTGLRADRNNRGIEYITNAIPFIGNVEGFELKFEAGQNNKISFKSDIIPFIGTMEGLSFKGATGEEDTNISARYTIAFD